MRFMKMLIPCILGVGLLVTGCEGPTKEIVKEDRVLVTDVDFEPPNNDYTILEKKVYERNMETSDENYEVELLYKGIRKEFNSADLFDECVNKIGQRVNLQMDITMLGDKVIDYNVRYLVREGTNSGK